MQQRQSAMQNTADKKRMEVQQTVSESTEIDLVELMYRLLEKWAIIILSCILGAVIACAYTLFMVTPQYTATSKLYVVNSNDSAINLSDLQIGSYLTKDYMEVFSNWHVHEMVLERLGLDYSYKQLSNIDQCQQPERYAHLVY